jgi:hypothetical protein
MKGHDAKMNTSTNSTHTADSASFPYKRSPESASSSVPSRDTHVRTPTPIKLQINLPPVKK